MEKPPGAPPVAAVKGRARGRARGRWRDTASEDGTEDSESRPGSVYSFSSQSSHNIVSFQSLTGTSNNFVTSNDSAESQDRFHENTFDQPHVGVPPHPTFAGTSDDEVSLISGFGSFVSSNRSQFDVLESDESGARVNLSMYDQSENPNRDQRLFNLSDYDRPEVSSVTESQSVTNLNVYDSSEDSFSAAYQTSFPGNDESDDSSIFSYSEMSSGYVGSRRGAFRGHASVGPLTRRSQTRGATAFGRGFIDKQGATSIDLYSDNELSVNRRDLFRENQTVVEQTKDQQSFKRGLCEETETSSWKVRETSGSKKDEDDWKDDTSGARAKVYAISNRIRGGGQGADGGSPHWKGGRGSAGGGRGGRGSARRRDPLEEQMQRLSLGKKVPPNIVNGKDGMKELISYMTVNTKPKQFRNENEGKVGESGKPVTLSSNSFQVDVAHDWWLYQYVVHFAPEQEGKRIRKQLVYNLK